MTLQELTDLKDNYSNIVDAFKNVLLSEGATPTGIKNLRELEHEVNRGTFELFNDTTSYLVNDMVSYNEELYKCLVDGINPITDNTKWEKISVSNPIEPFASGQFDFDGTISTNESLYNCSLNLNNSDFDIVFDSPINQDNYIIVYKVYPVEYLSGVSPFYSALHYKDINGFSIKLGSTHDLITPLNSIIQVVFQVYKGEI